jgi:Glyoxalase-like domain
MDDCLSFIVYCLSFIVYCPSALLLQCYITLMVTLDHIVVAAQTLEQGITYVQDSLGLELKNGGQHLKQGTHNKVLRLNDDCYLEVIAPDPNSTITPPWFGLGNKDMLESLKERPRLITWVAQTDDLETLVHLNNYPVNIQAAQRDRFRWRFSFPKDGNLIGDGLLPYLIGWESEHPVKHLPSTAYSLLSLEGFHPDPNAINTQLDALGLSQILQVKYGNSPRLKATFQTPTGNKTLS